MIKHCYLFFVHWFTVLFDCIADHTGFSFLNLLEWAVTINIQLWSSSSVLISYPIHITAPVTIRETVIWIEQKDAYWISSEVWPIHTRLFLSAVEEFFQIKVYWRFDEVLRGYFPYLFQFHCPSPNGDHIWCVGGWDRAPFIPDPTGRTPVGIGIVEEMSAE